MLTRAIAIFTAFALYSIADTGLSEEHAVGDRVIVIRNAELRVPGKKTGGVEVGRALKVVSVNTKWLWVMTDTSSGWINSDNVISFEKAVGHFDAAITREPTNAALLFARANILILKGDLNAARADCDKLIERDPNHSGAIGLRATIWRELREFDNAIADYGEVIRIGSQQNRIVAFNLRSQCWYDKGEYEKAFSDASKAMKLSPGNADAYINRGRASQAMGNLDSAFAEYSEAIQVAPSNTMALNNRGNISLDRGDLEEALKDFERTINLDPKHVEALTSRAIVRYRSGELANALHDCESAIDSNPKLWYPYNLRAWIRSTTSLASFRDGKQAVADGIKACELSDWEEWTAISTLAGAYAETGDYEKAVHFQEKALTKKITNPKLKTEAEERLALYREGKPFRETPPPTQAP